MRFHGLWMEGLFELVDIIGVYRSKTLSAVFAYQRRYNIVSALNIWRGRYGGPATRRYIAEMYAP